MKKNLFFLYSSFGEIIEINMNGSNKMRGQAFVVFREQEMADRALQELRDFSLFGKKMVMT